MLAMEADTVGRFAAMRMSATPDRRDAAALADRLPELHHQPSLLVEASKRATEPP